MSDYRLKRASGLGFWGALCVLTICPAAGAQGTPPTEPAEPAGSESGSGEDDATEDDATEESALKNDATGDSALKNGAAEDARGEDARGEHEATQDNSEPVEEGEISAKDVTAEEPRARAGVEEPTDRGRPRVIAIQDDSPPEPPVDPNTLPYTHHQLHYDLLVGARLNWVGHAGYDVFSENDLLAQFSARAGAGFWSSGRLSVAALLDWSYGSTSALARGQHSALAVQRIGVGIEGRYHLHERVFTYLRAVPGAMFTEARIGREADPTSPYASNWAFSLDGVVGAAVRLAGPADGTQDVPRLHLYLEGGYGFATDVGLSLSSDEEEGPARPQPLDLGTLSLSAPMVGAGLLLTL